MNFKASFIAILLGLTISATQANIQFSSEKQQEDYFTIDSVEVTEVEVPEYMKVENYVAARFGFDDGGITGDIPGGDTSPFPGEGSSVTTGLGDLIMVLENLLAFGKQVMDVVKEGKPVVSTNMADAISVIPRVSGTESTSVMHDMYGWSFPKAKGFRVALKNKSGKAPVVFHYTVYYQYNGKYEGKGQYLTGVNVVASKVYVGWGYDFKASSRLVAISNHGTNVDPVAGATLQIEYTVSNTFKSITKNEIFHIAGSGELVRAEVETEDLTEL